MIVPQPGQHGSYSGNLNKHTPAYSTRFYNTAHQPPWHPNPQQPTRSPSAAPRPRPVYSSASRSRFTPARFTSGSVTGAAPASSRG
eukprot:2568168-Rhodomonas_salina.1